MLPKSNHTVVLKQSKSIVKIHVIFALIFSYYLLVAIYPMYFKLTLFLVLLLVLMKNNYIHRIDDYPNIVCVQMSCGKIFKYDNFVVLFDLGFIIFLQFTKNDKQINRVVLGDQLTQVDRQYLHTRSYFQ